MNETSVSRGQSEVHQGDDIDFWQIIVPFTFLGLSLDDVTGIENRSVYVVLLSDLLHFYDDKGAVVESAKDVKDGCSLIDVIGKLSGVDVFNRGNRKFWDNGLNETDENVGVVGICEDSFESEVRHQRNVFGHGCSCVVG